MPCVLEGAFRVYLQSRDERKGDEKGRTFFESEWKTWPVTNVAVFTLVQSHEHEEVETPVFLYKSVEILSTSLRGRPAPDTSLLTAFALKPFEVQPRGFCGEGFFVLLQKGRR